MRRNFAQALKSGKIDIQKEYTKLFNLFYIEDDRDGNSIADLISINIKDYHFSGTCLDLAEFDEKYGFNFVQVPTEFDIDYLVNFCEYVYNLVLFFQDRFFYHSFNRQFYMQHILTLIEEIGYMTVSEGAYTIFVPKDNVAIAVSGSELLPDTLSYKVIEYNHHSLKGNLEQKRQTIRDLADVLEPKRKELSQIDRKFADDLFYAFNNLNIRHNNVDLQGKSYKKVVANLMPEQMEYWYDEVYQMCLLAFMRLEHMVRKETFDNLKNEIENN